MKGIWDAFEIAEVVKFAELFSCGRGGESAEITTSSEGIYPPKIENRLKRRSLYLPGNDVGSVRSKTTVNIEEKLILNRYAPKSRSIIGKSIPEEEESTCRDDTAEAALNNSFSSRAHVTYENDMHYGIQSTSQPFGHDRMREIEKDAILMQTQRQREPNYGNIIVVVRRDVKNNTIAINFEEKPS